MMSLYSVKDNNNIYFEYSMCDALTMADFSYLLYCKICLNHMNFIVLYIMLLCFWILAEKKETS